MIRTQRSGFAILGCRHGAEDVAGVVDRRNHHADYTNLPAIRACRPAWNKGRIVGQKRPLEPKHVWAIRVRLAVVVLVKEGCVVEIRRLVAAKARMPVPRRLLFRSDRR